MSITEDELVDSYGIGSAKERFDLIYENYSVFPQLVDCFEIGLFNTMNTFCSKSFKAVLRFGSYHEYIKKNKTS